MTFDEKLDEILKTNLRKHFDSSIQFDYYKETITAIKKLIAESLPEKSKAKWGSENQQTYVDYSHGFNTCRQEIIKSLNLPTEEGGR